MKNQKDEVIELSPNQLSPRNARPEDFQAESEQVEFGGACGDSQQEYRALLRVGPAARKDPRT
jgi:hypothetical protein